MNTEAALTRWDVIPKTSLVYLHIQKDYKQTFYNKTFDFTFHKRKKTVSVT